MIFFSYKRLNYLKRFGWLLCAATLLWSQIIIIPIEAQPISEEQKRIYRKGIQRFDLEAQRQCAGTVNLTGKDAKEKIWNFFIDPAKKLKPFQVAAILGNIEVESGYNPRRVQGAGVQESDKPTPGVGYGLVQWTDSARQNKLIERGGENVPKLDFQLEHIWWELNNTEKAAGDAFKATTNIRSATLDTFSKMYERPAVWNNPDRLTAAEKVLIEFGSNTGGSSSGGSSTSDNCSGASDGSSFVSGDYAWPVGLNKANVSAGYPLPCTGSSCHHDGSPAFDFAHKDTVKGGADNKSIGVPVFAIADGTVTEVGIYRSIVGCYALHFKAKDGFSYWYGHLRRPVSRTANAEYKAGDKIAEIGERKCTGNGSYPHLHIDRGSPKGRSGGLDCCRDAGMNTVINNLYKDLP